MLLCFYTRFRWCSHSQKKFFQVGKTSISHGMYCNSILPFSLQSYRCYQYVHLSMGLSQGWQDMCSIKSRTHRHVRALGRRQRTYSWTAHLSVCGDLYPHWLLIVATLLNQPMGRGSQQSRKFWFDCSFFWYFIWQSMSFWAKCFTFSAKTEEREKKEEIWVRWDI